jgi:hypothetical protein
MGSGAFPGARVSRFTWSSLRWGPAPSEPRHRRSCALPLGQVGVLFGGIPLPRNLGTDGAVPYHWSNKGFFGGVPLPWNLGTDGAVPYHWSNKSSLRWGPAPAEPRHRRSCALPLVEQGFFRWGPAPPGPVPGRVGTRPSQHYPDDAILNGSGIRHSPSSVASTPNSSLRIRSVSAWR